MTPSHVRYRAAPRPDRQARIVADIAGRFKNRGASAGPEAVTDAPERFRVGDFLHPEFELVRATRFGDEPLLGPLERQPFVVEQDLDPLNELEVARAVQALAGRVLLRTEELEL